MLLTMKKVLVVHSNSHLRAFIAETLREEGFEVNVAHDATLGIREFHQCLIKNEING